MTQGPVSRSELSTRLTAATRLPAIAASAGLVVAIAGAVGALLRAGQPNVALLRVSAAVAIGGGVLGLIGTHIAGVKVRQRLQDDVAGPVAGLLAVVTRAALEDFRGEAPQAGVSELREIASGFNHLLKLQRRQQHLNQTALDAVASRQQAAAEVAKLHKEAEAESQQDALTGLFNRRKLDLDLAWECQRCTANNTIMSYVMVDIDHFKLFNDTHGHQGGDELLRQMGALLAKMVRATDTCYRYGGEEFALILRGTPAEGACIMIDRLRERVAARFIELGTPITASFGVAALPAYGVNPEELIASADGALYVAKEQGRNRVVLGAARPAAPG